MNNDLRLRLSIELRDVADDGLAEALDADAGETGEAGETEEAAGEEVDEAELAESESALEKIKEPATLDGGEGVEVLVHEGDDAQPVEGAGAVLENHGNRAEDQKIHIEYVGDGLSDPSDIQSGEKAGYHRDRRGNEAKCPDRVTGVTNSRNVQSVLRFT